MTKATLMQMKSVTVDATLHAWVERMEEYKAGQHVNWDPDYDIRVWKEREAMLAETDQANEEEMTAKRQSTPMVEFNTPKIYVINFVNLNNYLRK